MRPSSFLIMYVPFLHFNPRIREGCDIADIRVFNRNIVLIHAPVKGATAKSHKIDSDFTVLFRKFMQKLGIAIFTISIFLEKQELYPLSSQCKSPGIFYVASDSHQLSHI